MNRTAKIFMTGRSQAVRLPKEFRFDVDEVYIRRDGDKVVLSPRPSSWESFFENAPSVDDDFLRDRDDPEPEKRELFGL